MGSAEMRRAMDRDDLDQYEKFTLMAIGFSAEHYEEAPESIGDSAYTPLDLELLQRHTSIEKEKIEEVLVRLQAKRLIKITEPIPPFLDVDQVVVVHY